MTAHGFRASASTILNSYGFNGGVIEAVFGHQDEDEMRRIYNRSRYWPERVNLRGDWANLMNSQVGLNEFCLGRYRTSISRRPPTLPGRQYEFDV